MEKDHEALRREFSRAEEALDAERQAVQQLTIVHISLHCDF